MGGMAPSGTQVASANDVKSSPSSIFKRLPNLFARHILWNTALYFEGPQFEVGDALTSPPIHIFRTKRLFRRRTDIVTRADPFLWAEGDTLNLFVEAEPEVGGGRIEAWSTKDLKHFTPHGEILREPFHLSYPFVFAIGERRYLLPESSEGNAVFLYEFDVFPTTVQRRLTLLEGKYFDSSLIEADGLWYLFTTSERGLEVYLTEDLLKQPLRPHPLNPISVDPLVSRCGGGVIRTPDGLKRLAQDCSSTYGSNLGLLAIDELAPDRYAERLIKANMFDRDQAWNRLGVHHLSLARFAGGTVIAIDGKQHDYYIHRLRELAYRALRA